jgi:sulfur carrier protein
MEVVINGELREVEAGLTVDVLISSLRRAAEGRGVAVAIDGEVVPRGSWDRTSLRDGARVEIVTAVQGG